MMMRALIVAAGLALAASGAGAEVAVQTKGAVQVVGKAALGANGRRGLAKFKQRARDFHGALYVSTRSDHAEWWVDEHRLEDAKQIARSNCEANDRAGGPCVLYAVIVPTGAAVGSGQMVRNVNAGLARDLARNAAKGAAGSHGAAAANRVGKYGMSWGHPTREAARKDALLTCLRSIEQGGGADVYSDYVSVGTFRQLVSSGRFDCKIVAEWRR
jgi:hypothetical protein